MSDLISELLKAANGDKSWSQAWQDFEETRAAVQYANEALQTGFAADLTSPKFIEN